MTTTSSTAQEEVLAGERFSFGKNWQQFLANVNEERIALAEASLRNMLEKESLEGLSFVDVGSGSGLFSLAARRLGARVHSFDYDPQSVACTTELRRRHFPSDDDWRVESGSALDQDYIKSLGHFDIVYSWGVLHHTGSMWQACENVVSLVKPGGKLFIAIYNDQGRASRRWYAIKRAYNRAREPFKSLLLFLVAFRMRVGGTIRDLLRGDPLRYWRDYGKNSARGMSAWRDIVDWIGGFPFEVAKPEEMFDFYRERGFELNRLVTWAGGHGCNEFVFEKR